MEFEFWVSSPRNVTFKYQEVFTLDDMGYSEEEWEDMDEKEREEVLEEYCNDLLGNYIEYGWGKKD